MYGYFSVAENITATQTVELHTLTGYSPGAGSVFLHVVGAASPQWLVTVEGRAHASNGYAAVPYYNLKDFENALLTSGGLSVTDGTAHLLLIPNPPPQIRVVMTRTSGSLSVRGAWFARPVAPVQPSRTVEYSEVIGGFSYPRSAWYQSTTGITANGAGTAKDMRSFPPARYSMQVTRTAGSTNAVEIRLELSLDGSNWWSAGSITDLSTNPNLISVADRPANYMRYNVVTVGAGNTLAIQIIATR